jgi:hypothetical protein
MAHVYIAQTHRARVHPVQQLLRLAGIAALAASLAGCAPLLRRLSGHAGNSACTAHPDVPTPRTPPRSQALSAGANIQPGGCGSRRRGLQLGWSVGALTDQPSQGAPDDT